MTLTIEKPETEARLIRFATVRGLSPSEALDELLSRESDETKLSREDVEALQEAWAAVDAGKVHPFDPEASNARADALIASFAGEKQA